MSWRAALAVLAALAGSYLACAAVVHAGLKLATGEWRPLRRWRYWRERDRGYWQRKR